MKKNVSLNSRDNSALSNRLKHSIAVLLMFLSTHLFSQTSLPGTVQAESYTGTVSGVGTAAIPSGGTKVNNFAPGKILNFNVSVTTAGTYNLRIRAAGVGFASGKLTFSGNNNNNTIAISPTGGYDTFNDFNSSTPITLSAGTQTMSLECFTNYFDVDRIVVTSSTSTPPTDNIAPTAPGQPTASAITATGVTLTWTASTDAVGVTGYDVFRGTTKVNATSITGLTYNVTGLTASTAYSFTVKARDAAGNISAASTARSVTTLAAPATDVIAPTAPGQPTASAITAAGVTLTWAASTDAGGVTGYDVFRGTTQVNTALVTGLTYNVTGLMASTAYSFTIKARDAAGNISPASTARSVTTLAAPVSGGGASSQFCGTTGNNGFENDLTGWTNVNGVGAVTTAAGEIRSGTKAAKIGPAQGGLTIATPLSVTAGAVVSFSVWARTTSDLWSGLGYDYLDAQGNVVANKSFQQQVTSSTYAQISKTQIVPVGAVSLRFWTYKNGVAGFLWIDDYCIVAQTTVDAIAPTAPGTPTVTGTNCTFTNVSWTASTDAVGVVGYRIYSGSTLLKEVGNVTSTSLTGLTQNTAYSITVRAFDITGNVSGNSGPRAFSTTNTNCTTIFTGTGVDIGNASATPGSDSFDAATGIISITGGGTNLNGFTDATGDDGFRFNYVKMSGDFEVVARVREMNNTGYHARAGVMVRASLEPKSRNGFMGLAVGQPYVQWMHRTFNGDVGKSSSTVFPVANFYWVKVIKTDGSVSGWYSADGVDWINYWSAEGIYAANDEMYVGLAVSSFNSGTTSTAQFDNVRVTPLTFSQPAATAAPTRTRKLGTNLWYIYSVDSQKDAAVWTGGHPWRQENPDFTQANPWNQHFLNNMKIYQTIRFMDWAATNNSTAKLWEDRTIKTDGFQGSWEAGVDQARGKKTVGMAWDWMIDLCNRNNSDMWLNIPHLSIDPADFPNGDDFNNEYAHKLAILLKHGVDMRAVNLKNYVGGKALLNQLANKTKAELVSAGGVDVGSALTGTKKIYIEYSNELWLREQNKYANAKAGVLGIPNSNFEDYGAWADVRCWKAFEDVFGANSSRLVKVAGHTTSNNATDFNRLFTNVYDNTSANRNPWNIRPTAWKTDSYCTPGYKSGEAQTQGNDPNVLARFTNEVTGMVNFKTPIKTFMTGKGIQFISYEGGHHYEQYGGNFNENPASYDAYIDWAKRFAGLFDLACHYTHYGKWQLNTQNIFNNWGAIAFDEQPIAKAHKYRALRDWVTATGAGARESAVSAIYEEPFVEFSDKVKVFPNPASGSNKNVTIEFDAELGETSQISLMDITGQMFSNFYTNERKAPLNTATFKTGTYIIRVQNSKMSSATKLIVE
jgi:chitodextrinase